MNSSVVFPPDLSRPQQTSDGFGKISPRSTPSPSTRKPSFAHAMKQAEAGTTNGASNSEPRRRSSSSSDTTPSTRSRTESEPRPRSARNACSPRGASRAADHDTVEQPEPTPSAADSKSPASLAAAGPKVGESERSNAEADAHDAATTDSPKATQSDDDDAAQPSNIIVLPPPANILPFPLMQAAPETVAIESVLAGQAPAVEVAPLTTAGGENSSPPRSEGLNSGAMFAEVEAPVSDASGMSLRTSELRPLTSREQMAVSLRLAMARLEEDDPAHSSKPKMEVDAKVVPFPGAEEDPERNIVEVQFASVDAPRAATSTSKASLTDAAPASDHPVGTETQLPVRRPTPATIARAEATQSEAPPASAPAPVSKSNDSAKPGGGPTSSTTGGTSTAWKDRNMDSTSTIAAFSGPEDALGSVGPESDEAGSIPEAPRLESNDRLSPAHWPISGNNESQVHRTGGLSPESSRPVEAAASVERIATLVGRETTLFRQHGSDSMAVVLRPDANTELLVHLSRHNGQIEANVRCERGDFQQLNALWSQLQEALGHQKVRLAPLEESTGDTSQFRQTGGGLSQQGQNREESGRQSPADHQSMEEWPAPASPLQDPAHVRSRTGDLGRRHSTSRPGWETWA